MSHGNASVIWRAATPPLGSGSPQTTTAAAVDGQEQEIRIAAERQSSERQRDQSLQSPPRDCEGKSSRSAMAGPASAIPTESALRLFRQPRKLKIRSNIRKLLGFGTWIRTKIDGAESGVLPLNYPPPVRSPNRRDNAAQCDPLKPLRQRSVWAEYAGGAEIDAQAALWPDRLVTLYSAPDQSGEGDAHALRPRPISADSAAALRAARRRPHHSARAPDAQLNPYPAAVK